MRLEASNDANSASILFRPCVQGGITHFRANSLLISCAVSGILITFAPPHADADVKAEADGWGCIYGKGVCLTLCSLTLRSLANLNPDQKQSNGGCPRDM